MNYVQIMLCRKINKIKNISFYSTQAEHLLKQPLTDMQTKLYEKHKQTILYSSFLEENKIKLGYQKNKILQNLLHKIKKNTLNDNNTTPISLVAQTLRNNNGEPIQTESQHSQHNNNLLNNTQNYEKTKLLKKFTERQHEINDKYKGDGSWMCDYETFKGDDYDGRQLNQFGTSDATVPVSTIPCYGCGAFLQCANSSLPGYLPSELFRDQPDTILKTITCQRCYFLKKYQTAINLTVSPDEYVKMISSIEDKFALAILMVDLTDLEGSIWPKITNIIGVKRPVFIVGNKVDLLPKDSRGYLDHIKKCLQLAIINAGIETVNIQHICLISAQTGYGVEELITKLHNVWQYKGDVYLMGCTNVGKSSLFNALLRSDYCKVKASNIIQKATASQWPGTTLRMLKFPILRPSDMIVFKRMKRLLSERTQKAAEEKLRRDQAKQTGNVKYATLIGHIGRTFEHKESDNTANSFSIGTGFQNPILTLNEQAKEYVTSKWCYDTPGVVNQEQIINILTTAELLQTIPSKMLRPKTYIIRPTMTMFLAGIGRIDYLNGPNWLRLTVYAADSLPITIVQTNAADEVYRDFLGTEFFAVPHADNNIEKRLTKWPTLESVHVELTGEGENISACDILLSSAGWTGVSMPSNTIGKFRIWTPQRKGIFIRKPALIPYGVQLRGSKIRYSLAYQSTRSFVKQ